MSKIIVIVGQTGIGKTRLSIELAEHFNAEIINADSVSVYKEPCIGAAKVTIDEMKNIKHHLLNVVSLNENFTVYDFQQEGRKVLNKLINENKNIIIVGGSGLYIKALLYNYEFSKEENEREEFEDKTNIELKQEVDKIYKENDIHENNRKRLIRFLNHYYNTGKIIKTKEEKDKPIYDFTIIGLTIEREKLNEIIGERVDKMINLGLEKEVKDLYDKKLNKINTLIGYKEFIPYFNNEISLNETIEEIKKNTRNFSKRQMTWYKNQMKDINWFNVNINDFSKTINEVIMLLDKN